MYISAIFVWKPAISEFRGHCDNDSLSSGIQFDLPTSFQSLENNFYTQMYILRTAYTHRAHRIQLILMGLNINLYGFIELDVLIRLLDIYFVIMPIDLPAEYERDKIDNCRNWHGLEITGIDYTRRARATKLPPTTHTQFIWCWGRRVTTFSHYKTFYVLITSISSCPLNISSRQWQPQQSKTIGMVLHSDGDDNNNDCVFSHKIIIINMVLVNIFGAGLAYNIDDDDDGGGVDDGIL